MNHSSAASLFALLLAGEMALFGLLAGLPGCRSTPADSSVYLKRCASCHSRSGAGLARLYPALHGSSYLGERIKELPCLIKHGVRGNIATADGSANRRMPPFPDLSLDEMSSLVIFLRDTWGSGREPISEEVVAQWLQLCR
jgi:mono/diheme cytochrome c family protein